MTALSRLKKFFCTSAEEHRQEGRDWAERRLREGATVFDLERACAIEAFLRVSPDFGFGIQDVIRSFDPPSEH